MTGNDLRDVRTMIDEQLVVTGKAAEKTGRSFIRKAGVVITRHLGIMQIEIKAATAYNVDFLMKIVLSMLTMALTYYLWTAIYNSSTSMSMTYRSLITYVCLGQAFSVGKPTQRGIFASIGFNIRSGDVLLDLVRPADYQAMNLSSVLGSYFLDTVAVSLPSYILSMLFFGVSLPVSYAAAAGFVLSLMGALFLVFSIDFFLGILAFWTTSVWGLGYAKMAVIDIFAGAIVPLSLFPGWLQRIVMVLPFKGMAYTPLAIYIGQLKGSAMVTGIMNQFAWGIGLVLLTRLLWIKARRRIEIQGG